MKLSNREWAVLREMARSLYKNAEKHEGGYCWTVGDTLVDNEVALLKKLACDMDEFKREVYLRSDPSVDIRTTEVINCRKHAISYDVYKQLLDEFGIESGSKEMFDANCFMLNNGPKIIH